MAMSYNKYPKEMKDAVVSRILSGEETLSDICRETGINIFTDHNKECKLKFMRGHWLIFHDAFLSLALRLCHDQEGFSKRMIL